MLWDFSLFLSQADASTKNATLLPTLMVPILLEMPLFIYGI